jgi:predicted TIM-barrel fold metal-dependent hydrolase
VRKSRASFLSGNPPAVHSTVTAAAGLHGWWTWQFRFTSLHLMKFGRRILPRVYAALASFLGCGPALAQQHPDQWRREHRLIDLHQHVSATPQHIARAVQIMDRVGVGIAVNLSGGTVVRAGTGPSALERNKALADRHFPGRIVHYMNLDFSEWDDPAFSELAAGQIEEGFRLGAAGLKLFKNVGLNLRDKSGALLRIDDPRLDAAWRKCGELGLPVSIHVADPRAFWLPYSPANERWAELKDHPNWWFGDPGKYPPREEFLAALNRVIARHPETTFVCVHFANNAEDLEWVEARLDEFPNMHADLAARIPEIGRQEPEKVRRLFIKHQDRILFGTDFQVRDRLTLGSGGSGPAPTDDDAADFFEKHWRWLETDDRDFAHMTPIQGEWTISAIGLPPAVLRKIYFDNARKLLGRSLPVPTLAIPVLDRGAKLDGRLDDPAWSRAAVAWLEYESSTYGARPEMATEVRIFATAEDLYFGFTCPFTTLSMFPDPDPTKERMGLWENDVVEIFMGTGAGDYKEFEVAPSGETLDVVVRLPEKDFAWTSGFEARVARGQDTWVAEIRIPRRAVDEDALAAGAPLLLNLYRHDRANAAKLAWSPTLTRTFHHPARFGTARLEHGEATR